MITQIIVRRYTGLYRVTILEGENSILFSVYSLTKYISSKIPFTGDYANNYIKIDYKSDPEFVNDLLYVLSKHTDSNDWNNVLTKFPCITTMIRQEKIKALNL